jgi:hypothetical protein
MTQTVRTSETSAYFYETTRYHVPEGCYVHTFHRENIKSQKYTFFEWLNIMVLANLIRLLFKTVK